MAKSFDIGLNAKINTFCEKFDLDRTNDSDVFENFSNYVVISTLLEDELEDVNKVSTNKAQGIDGIGIFVNDRLIVEEADLEKLGDGEKLKVKISFIQSTIQNSFSEQKFQSFIDTVINFLSNNFQIEPFSTILNKLLSEEGDYIDNLSETPLISLYFISAKTSHSLTESVLNPEKSKLSNRIDLLNKYNLDNIYFWQKDEIKEQYNKIAKYHTISLNFYKGIQLEDKNDVKISLLSAIKFSELKKMILTNDDNMKERLFVENPRAHLGDTSVNNDIRETIKNEDYNPYFIYLNNGLTILCDSIERHTVKENEYILKYPRIINGCQTTHILYDQYKKTPKKLENIEVIAKVIATENNELKKQIIFAANNQNSIDKDLESLNEFHEEIEQYFQGTDYLRLYFERLRGQYSNITHPYKKINIENLAKIYISVFLKEPHKMKSNAIKKINEYQVKKKIFDSNVNNAIDYYYCGILYYWLNNFLLSKELVLKSKTMDMHLLLTCNLLLEKENKNITEEKVKYLSIEENAKSIFTLTNSFVESEDYLFERRGFYSSPKTTKLIESIEKK